MSPLVSNKRYPQAVARYSDSRELQRLLESFQSDIDISLDSLPENFAFNGCKHDSLSGTSLPVLEHGRRFATVTTNYDLAFRQQCTVAQVLDELQQQLCSFKILQLPMLQHRDSLNVRQDPALPAKFLCVHLPHTHSLYCVLPALCRKSHGRLCSHTELKVQNRKQIICTEANLRKHDQQV